MLRSNKITAALNGAAVIKTRGLYYGRYKNAHDNKGHKIIKGY